MHRLTACFTHQLCILTTICKDSDPLDVLIIMHVFIYPFVATSLRTSLTTSNGVPCKLGPTRGIGQCLVNEASQGAEEWLGVDHQDVLMFPRQQSESDVTLDISDSNSRAGPRVVGLRPYTSYQ